MIVAVLLFQVLLTASLPATSESTGMVCVNRFGPDPPEPCPTGPASPETNPVPEFRWESTRFKVQFDDLEPVEISCFRSASVSGLRLHAKHKVQIWLGPRRIESFFFTFEKRGANRLCLDFDPYYGTWKLESLQPGTQKPCPCLPSRDP